MGLMIMFGYEFVKWNCFFGEVRYCNGVYVKFMGIEKFKRWNGSQWLLLWFDEFVNNRPFCTN